jgi:hypothetical protein
VPSLIKTPGQSTLLEEEGVRPSIPERKSSGKLVKYDKRNYKRLNRLEIMFGRPEIEYGSQCAIKDARAP